MSKTYSVHSEFSAAKRWVPLERRGPSPVVEEILVSVDDLGEFTFEFKDLGQYGVTPWLSAAEDAWGALASLGPSFMADLGALYETLRSRGAKAVPVEAVCLFLDGHGFTRNVPEPWVEKADTACPTCGHRKGGAA